MQSQRIEDDDIQVNIQRDAHKEQAKNVIDAWTPMRIVTPQKDVGTLKRQQETTNCVKDMLKLAFGFAIFLESAGHVSW